MKATIRNVAALAQVSPATVSRVLSGKARVEDATKERVEWAIRKINFTPNVIAQGLNSKTMHTIGVVVTRTTELAFANPYFSEVIKGIGRVAETEDFNLLFNTFCDQEREKEECFKLLRSGRVDGLILLSSRVYDVLIHELMEYGCKFVLIGRVIDNTIPNYQDVCWVNTDNLSGSELAVEHLIGRGHRKIAIIYSPLEYVVSQDRYMGYRQALAINGIRPEKKLEIDGGYTLADAKQAVKTSLINNKEITAIFASDDLKAVAAIQAAQEMNYKIPEDLAVVGYNDYDIATIINPPLTTIRVPIHDLGMKAAKLMIDLIKGKTINERQINLPIELVIRQST